jgi:hypothetical protein
MNSQIVNSNLTLSARPGADCSVARPYELVSSVDANNLPPMRRSHFSARGALSKIVGTGFLQSAAQQI